jgi:hypothetical protein
LRTTFRGAKRYARKRSLETGQEYVVPTRSEWELMSSYSKLMGGKPMGGFHKVSQAMDGVYWSSESMSLFNAVSVAPKSHPSHRYIKSARLRKSGVRLIRYVRVEDMQEKQVSEQPSKPAASSDMKF